MSTPWTIVLDHVAVATPHTKKLLRVLDLLGLIKEGEELVASQGVNTHFIKPSPSDPAVEILEVTDNQGIVAKFLEKKGPGIHHLSFRVERKIHSEKSKESSALDLLCSKLRAEGIRLTYEKPAPGANHTRVNFIHPESTGGILIEISEKAF